MKMKITKTKSARIILFTVISMLFITACALPATQTEDSSGMSENSTRNLRNDDSVVIADDAQEGTASTAEESEENAESAADADVAEMTAAESNVDASDALASTAADADASASDEGEAASTMAEPDAEPAAASAAASVESDAANSTMAGSDSATETDVNNTAGVVSETEIFTIDPAQSEARFALDEDLRGNRITVLGVTSAINGEITIDPATPANTQIGPITIDATTFVTDSERRDGAIRRFVLGTNSYPTITFASTELNALPDSIAVGDTVSFEIRGDLTLAGQTLSEIFKATITIDTAEQISGSATTTILYADYGIFIPDVPFIANVEDELELEFDFVAKK